jgi:hypothetical protein
MLEGEGVLSRRCFDEKYGPFIHPRCTHAAQQRCQRIACGCRKGCTRTEADRETHERKKVASATTGQTRRPNRSRRMRRRSSHLGHLRESEDRLALDTQAPSGSQR